MKEMHATKIRWNARIPDESPWLMRCLINGMIMLYWSWWKTLGKIWSITRSLHQTLNPFYHPRRPLNHLLTPPYYLWQSPHKLSSSSCSSPLEKFRSMDKESWYARWLYRKCQKQPEWLYWQWCRTLSPTPYRIASQNHL